MKIFDNKNREYVYAEKPARQGDLNYNNTVLLECLKTGHRVRLRAHDWNDLGFKYCP